MDIYHPRAFFVRFVRVALGIQVAYPFMTDVPSKISKKCCEKAGFSCVYKINLR
jgi:hypothetical protein